MANDPTQPDSEIAADEWAYRQLISRNLKRLMMEKGENQSTLAEKSGVGQTTIGRYVRCEATANSYTLKQLADAMNVGISHIGTDSTRFGVDPTVNGSAHGSNVKEGLKTVLVPLISWVQLGAWQVEKAHHQVEAEAWLPCPVPCGPVTFAVKVRGVSMEPKFADGDIIFVDPAGTVAHGKRVLASVNNEVVLRELVIDGNRRFLTLLNANFPGNRFTEVRPEDRIIGVVVGKWVPES